MSDKVVGVDFPNTDAVKCRFCNRTATRLCDIVTGVWKWAGHSPRVNGVYDENVPAGGNITCDAPMCDKCSIHLNEHMDICPDCYNKIQSKKRIKNSK